MTTATAKAPRATAAPKLPTPMPNRVLCKRLDSTWTSKEGVIVPFYVPGEEQGLRYSEAKREFPLARIVALAERYYHERLDERTGRVKHQIPYVPTWTDRRMRPGDVVLLHRHAGSDIPAIDNHVLPLITDILARYDGEPEGNVTTKPRDDAAEVPVLTDAELDAVEDVGPSGESYL